MSVHITLLSTRPDDQQHNLLVESLGKGLLDSGCTKTVTGELWLQEYLTTLSESEIRGIREKQSKSVFRFGDGIENKSTKCITIPVTIGKKKLQMDVEVVPNEIPLLVSKAAMKQMKMQLDFTKDTAIIGGEKVELVCNSLGHYCIPITKERIESHNCNVVLHVQNLETMTHKEKQKKALKLHRQLSHATKERILRLLKSSGCEDEDFLRCVADCCDQCVLCQKYRKPRLRPVVGFPMSDRFNQVVSMDLKECKHHKSWILHLIDIAKRYSAA